MNAADQIAASPPGGTWHRISSSYQQLAEAVSQIRVFDLVVLLTAYALFRISHTPLDMSLTVISVLLMFRRALRHSPWFWFAVAGSWLPRLLLNTYQYEDHVFLVVYWCGALGLALWGGRQGEVMKRSARLLIGLSFGIAFLWKIISVEFYDGSLFHFKLLYDYRFGEMVTQPVGGLSGQASAANYETYRSLRSFDQTNNLFPVELPGRVTWIAHAMTSWTILIEGAIAALFLLPATRLTDRWRDASLLLFIATTYIIVPVLGFASIFTAMGVAQLSAERKRTRLAYLLTLLALTGWFTVRWHCL